MKTINRLGNRRFLLFTLILCFKCSLAWFVVFDDGPRGTTILTELPFIWAIFCLIEWFSSKRTLLYYAIANLLFTILYFTVLMYFKYYGIIVTYHALSQADKVTKLGESTYSLMDPYYLLMFVDIIVMLAIYLYARKNRSKQAPIRLRPYRRQVVMSLFFVSVLLCVLSIWPNRASMNENKQAEEMGILNYEVFTILSDSIEEAEVVEMEGITQPVIDELKGMTPSWDPRYFGAGKGRNVIIVQLESFQNFLIGLTVEGKEVTPNINRIARESFYFNNFYATVGQGTTSDAEYVVNTSLYVPEHEPATKDNVKKNLPSMPKLLQGEGYKTATFHTNEVEFWNRKELYRALGWDSYYDKSFFGDEDHVAFGASDETLYDKTFEELMKMNESGKPYYAQLISMSAHHPYNVPESKVRFELPETMEGMLVGNYLQAQNYADYALGQFIDELKASGQWDNSIIVFYGDHQGLPVYSLDKKQQEVMKEMLGHEYGYSDMFNIPLVLHVPNVTYPSVIEKTGGQIDILPTIANLTGISLSNQIHFGADLLNLDDESNLLPMRHFLPSGSLITDSDLFVPGNAYEDGTNYPLDGQVSSEDRVSKEQFDNALKLLNLSDSYITQLEDLERENHP